MPNFFVTSQLYSPDQFAHILAKELETNLKVLNNKCTLLEAVCDGFASYKGSILQIKSRYSKSNPPPKYLRTN